MSIAALLYIHRCFFAHAISNHPNDPIKSPYAPSFLAGYRSACELLSSLRLQFNTFPAEIARFWVLWTHAFSSAVRSLRLALIFGLDRRDIDNAFLRRDTCDALQGGSGGAA
jgi:hypothetical protein